jgi:aspartate/methionine/tyrosine aminotransferase
MPGMPRANTGRYPIAAIRQRMREHDGPMLDFAVGSHREDPPDAVLDLIRREVDGGLLAPSGQDELDAYADAVVGMLDRIYGLRVATASILPVPGGRTALSLLASALIRPSDEVAVVEPAYPAFLRVVSHIGARVRSVPLDPERGFVPDESSLDPETAGKVAFVALNFPNNPTGAAPTVEALAGFLKRCRRGTIVFNDATYGPLTYDRPPWSLLAEGASLAGELRLVELHSVAKLFATGPLPVSFLAGEEPLIAELRELSEFAWSPQSRLQVQVARICLEDRDRLEGAREFYRERIARLRDTLVELGFEPYPAPAGMYILCRVPSSIGQRTVADAGEAAEVLLSEHGVAVVPWEVPPHSYLRFSARYLEKDLDALRRLGGDVPLVGR